MPMFRANGMLSMPARHPRRLASAVPRVCGQAQPLFTPHVDTGDFVIVINADKIRLTGKKWCRSSISGTPAISED